MRLIDADKITDKEIIRYLGSSFASCVEDVRLLLDEQPTAFDVDNIVKQLEDEAEQSYADFEKYIDDIYVDFNGYDDYHFLGLKRAIEIIKQKGIK